MEIWLSQELLLLSHVLFYCLLQRNVIKALKTILVFRIMFVQLLLSLWHRGTLRTSRTSLSRPRERPLMGAGLVEADRMGGWGEEEEDDVRMGGEADEERVGGWGEEAASTGGEDEEEEERTGGWGGERSDDPSCCRCDAPFSSAGGRSSLDLEDMLSKAFSMLSRRPLRSENQQSTSVLDSRVSWASWSAVGQSTGGQRLPRSRRSEETWELRRSPGNANMGSLRTFPLPFMLTPETAIGNEVTRCELPLVWENTTTERFRNPTLFSPADFHQKFLITSLKDLSSVSVDPHTWADQTVAH